MGPQCQPPYRWQQDKKQHMFWPLISVTWWRQLSRVPRSVLEIYVTPPYFWSWVIYNVQFLWKIMLPFVDLKSCKMCSLHEMLDMFISLKTDAYRDKSEQSYKVTGYRCTRLPLIVFSSMATRGIVLDPPVSKVYSTRHRYIIYLNVHTVRLCCKYEQIR